MAIPVTFDINADDTVKTIVLPNISLLIIYFMAAFAMGRYFFFWVPVSEWRKLSTVLCTFLL